MGKTQQGRVPVIMDFERVSEAISKLEDFAEAFPELRGEVMGIMERSSTQEKRFGRVLRSTSDRIAAIEMLEILHSE